MAEVNNRIAILASGDLESGGGGSTADKVTRDTLERQLSFSIGVVICNNPPGTVGVYDKFDAINREFGLKGEKRINVVTIGPSTHPEGRQPRGQTLSESAAIRQTLKDYDIGFVAMLGYMRILTGVMVEEGGWKPEYGAADPTNNGIYHPDAWIFNDHPGILPFTADTHGQGTHKKAISLFRQGRIKRTAMTWHLAGAGVDTGAVIHAEPIDIEDTDDAKSLGNKVQGVEKELTATVLDRHLIFREQHTQRPIG
jgi:folate-dependent phosphoribosylglycinamide formyltransferase PurN